MDLRGDGRIILFLRSEAKNPKYYVRLKIPNSKGYKTVSTKTNNLIDSQRISLDLYDELYHQIQVGGTLQSKTYKDVFDEWSTHRKNSYQYKPNDRTSEYVAVYSLDYFGSMKINKIQSKDFHEYWDWRKLNFKRKKPSDDTLNRERTSIMGLFKFSYQRGYVTELISIPKLKTKGINKRPTFNMGEWKTITTMMRKWVEEGRPLGRWRERFILQQYVLLMSNSGVRVGEMRNLKWEDVSSVDTDEGKQIVLRVSGKVGMRDVVLNPNCEVYLRRLYDLRKDELKGKRPTQFEYVFLSRKTMKPYTSFKTSFNGMLEYCGIPIGKNGMNRTIYSLRHFYGTERLKGNISPYILAKQMGTSVEMIEKHYGHILTKDIIASIRKTTNQKSSNIQTENSYPFD